MPNLAQPFKSAVVAMVVAASAETSIAQSVDEAWASGQGFSIRQFVLPTEFRIQAESSRAHRFQVMLTNEQSWSGVMEMGGQVWTATERGCPSFKASLEAFGRLPPLYPGPYALRNSSQPRELGPRTLHAESWTLKVAGFAPDHTNVDMDISGSQGPYPQWASQMVEAIKSCGPPVS